MYNVYYACHVILHTEILKNNKVCSDIIGKLDIFIILARQQLSLTLLINTVHFIRIVLYLSV